jgi:type IV secretion system protein VirB9
MRSLGALLVAAALVSAAPAHALDTPKPGPSDPRIKIVDYDPWAVVKVTGVFRTATQILLGADETILHVAVGDATGWDVAAEKNILFVTHNAGYRLRSALSLSAGREGGGRGCRDRAGRRARAAHRRSQA